MSIASEARWLCDWCRVHFCHHRETWFGWLRGLSRFYFSFGFATVYCGENAASVCWIGIFLPAGPSFFRCLRVQWIALVGRLVVRFLSLESWASFCSLFSAPFFFLSIKDCESWLFRSSTIYGSPPHTIGVRGGGTVGKETPDRIVRPRIERGCWCNINDDVFMVVGMFVRCLVKKDLFEFPALVESCFCVHTYCFVFFLTSFWYT